MSSIAIAYAVVPLKTSIALMARIRGVGGELITQASFSGITFTTYDCSAAPQDLPLTAHALTVASVVFDNLQQSDPRWEKDTAQAVGRDGSYGYNFLATVASTYFTDYDQDETFPYTLHGHVYQVDVRFAGVDGSVFTQPFKIGTVPTFGAA